MLKSVFNLSAGAVLALVLAGAGKTEAARPAETLPKLNFTVLGTHGSGVFNKGGSEIVAHDPTTHRLFVVNAQAAALDVLDMSNPTALTLLGSIPLSSVGGIANSVAVHDEIVAVAVESVVKTDPGAVYFFAANDLTAPLSFVTVGSLPDMLTFSPNGRYVLVANEGEPNSYNQADSVDPEGSISIIDLSGGVANLTQANVRTADFRGYNGREGELRNAGIRIFGPNASAAQDFEPEYIAVSHDSRTAWVTLQENNAMAVVDIENGVITEVIALGYKDHRLPHNGLDPSDRDNTAGTGPAINIRNMPVYGMYQPDGIASYKVGNDTFLVMANEGDSRDYPGFNEEITIAAATNVLAPSSFTAAEATALKRNSNLGRLKITNAKGKDASGNFTALYAFGGRSFSIRKPDGTLVFDSGDEFEQKTAEKYPANFNSNHTSNNFDNRSTGKGPEPEGVALGRVFGRMFAFIGLERIGGLMIYDITDPYAARFVDYVNNRNFAAAPTLDPPANLIPNPAAGDLGPEGVIFISEENSPTGKPLLVTGNEISGTTTVIEITRAE